MPGSSGRHCFQRVLVADPEPESRLILLERHDARDQGVRCVFDGFEVRDTGLGVAPEHIPRLTERFYRVDKSRSRETGGTGLGLAIVKHVLLRHGGYLDVQSEIGLGSTFSAVLPAERLLTASDIAVATA